MPDGEIYTSPVEDGVNGFIKFDYPACYNGVEVHGVDLGIEKGLIVHASATKGKDFLLKMLATDDGARRIGELAFGLNDNITTFSKNILFDEKIGGTCHLAIGASYPDAGGLNKSGLHWDIVRSMKDTQVYADGKLIYEDGHFLI
jgi:aminopeptidase